MKRHNHCAVCDSPQIDLFLTRDNTPVHQHQLLKTEKRALTIGRGDLELMVCNRCGFIFNRAFRFEKLSYNSNYDNSQNYSDSFSQHTLNLVHHLINECSVQGKRIVEIGCGKGAFLRALLQSPGGETNTGVGFDPVFEGPETELAGRLKFIKDFYGPQYSGIDADVILCRHVIEHIPDPIKFLKIIKESLNNSSSVKIFFETPCVTWILHNGIIWDFFYEHCSYFTPYSIKVAFQEAGLRVEGIKHVFGGQYLWVEAVGDSVFGSAKKNGTQTAQSAKKLAQGIQDWVNDWTKRIEKMKKNGPVIIWGAGAKGVTFANLIDPKKNLIHFVIDINPKKQGHYVPGTGHPIIDVNELDRTEKSNIILMNPNYRQEVESLLDKNMMCYNLVS